MFDPWNTKNRGKLTSISLRLRICSFKAAIFSCSRLVLAFAIAGS